MKKILLYLIAILTPFIFISKVNALSTIRVSELSLPLEILVGICSDSTKSSCGNYYAMMQSNDVTNGQNISYYQRNMTINDGQYVSMKISTKYGFKKDDYYSFTYFLGGIHEDIIRNGSYDIGFGTGQYLSAFETATAPYSTVQTRNIVLLGDDLVTYKEGITAVTVILKGTEAGNWFALNFKTDYATTENIYFYGYVFNYAGSSLADALNASGLATSTQLSEVESSINSTIIEQETETQNKIDETNNALSGDSNDESSSSCGVICKLKNLLSYINPLSEKFFAYKLVELLIDALKSLIVPDDMSFVTDFVDALESKLGFIGAIPGQIIEFAINLVSASWTEFNSISFPSISIFGYNFWNSQEIDLTEAINIFKPFKYVTDCICVVLCARTLNKWREQFTGGSSE